MGIKKYLSNIFERIKFLNSRISYFSENKYNPFYGISPKTYVWIETDIEE